MERPSSVSRSGNNPVSTWWWVTFDRSCTSKFNPSSLSPPNSGMTEVQPRELLSEKPPSPICAMGINLTSRYCFWGVIFEFAASRSDSYYCHQTPAECTESEVLKCWRHWLWNSPFLREHGRIMDKWPYFLSLISTRTNLSFQKTDLVKFAAEIIPQILTGYEFFSAWASDSQTSKILPLRATPLEERVSEILPAVDWWQRDA